MATIKIKFRGKWVDANDVAALREQEQGPPVEPPPVDPATLPDKASLDPEVPFAQLFFEHPEVRPYITAEGKVRGGLPPAQRMTAEQIITRYGGSI